LGFRSTGKVRTYEPLGEVNGCRRFTGGSRGEQAAKARRRVTRNPDVLRNAGTSSVARPTVRPPEEGIPEVFVIGQIF